MTSQLDGLLLYNGPLGNPDQQLDVTDFIAIWFVNGYVHARVNLGDADVDLAVTDATGATAVNDGQWHTVEFIREQKVCMLRMKMFKARKLLCKEPVNSHCKS